MSESQIVFEDRTILCCDCGEEFVFAAGEQLFFSDKGLKNDPKRCKQCKREKNERMANVQAAHDIIHGGDVFLMGRRVACRVTCADCSADTTVPFVPTQGRPVYCRDCFLKHKEDNPAAA